MRKNTHPYADILDAEYKKSETRQHMSNHDRAAQFAPFAALTGYDEVIGETARLTDSRPELDPETADILNRTVAIIKEKISERPELEIEYFVPDSRKSGGAMCKYVGKLRRIDDVERIMVFEDGFSVNTDDVFEIIIK